MYGIVKLQKRRENTTMKNNTYFDELNRNALQA
jgi:hypothetical protein